MLMKTFHLFTMLLLSFNITAQKGGVQIECLNQHSKSAIQNLKIEIHNDSLCLEGLTDSEGKYLFRELPLGESEIWFERNNQIKTTKVFIQENQLLQNTFFFDSLFVQQKVQFGDQYVNDPKGVEPNGQISTNSSMLRVRMVDANLSSKTVYSYQEISCMSITAYRTPLINRDGGASGATITREDISRLPARSVNGIIVNVGGVNSIEGSNSIHFRGSRSDGNTYYLDGIRVKSADQIPKSYINGVQVITGGIPANYGDVTGGVVAVESKSYANNQPTNYSLGPKSLKKSRNVQTTHDEEERDLFNYDQFLPIYENDFLSTLSHANSTFGIDVDRASWTYVKTMLQGNQHVQRDAIKMEEMINAFHYVDVPQNELINVAMRRLECPWNNKHELVSVHLKAKDLPKDLPRKKHNLVFLIDVSGSMSGSNKLDLLTQGLKRFVQSLNHDDYVSIVTYAGASGVVLEPTSCDQKDKIIASLDQLTSGGSTNGIGGISEAYSLAEKHFDPQKNNRIILATDGDFNVGISAPGDLENFISSKRGKGIYLTALGFGMGNYKNSTLETLADKGDGNHFYINNLTECKKVLIDDLGNILNIARDVKLNVEFNPNEVKEYRLIGYENRMLKPKDFEDDLKDAGEIGYGHEVTAVYEIIPGKSESDKNHFTKTKETLGNGNELAFVKLRYKPFEDTVSIEKNFTLFNAQEIERDLLLEAVIGFGLHLRNSAFKGDLTLELLRELSDKLVVKNEEESELKKLIENYATMP
jgi:Ca-activated chloride channel family protein